VTSSAPGDATSAAAAAALVDAVRSLAKQSNRYAEATRRRMGMNASDLTALGLVYDHALRGRGMTPGELAVELDLSPSATTALVDRLESAGHLVRTRHESDGRRVVLSMTETASDVGRRAFSPLARLIVESLHGRSPQELALVVDVLTTVTTAIDSSASELHSGAGSD